MGEQDAVQKAMNRFYSRLAVVKGIATKVCRPDPELARLQREREELYDAILAPEMPRTQEAVLQAITNLTANERHYRVEVEQLKEERIAIAVNPEARRAFILRTIITPAENEQVLATARIAAIPSRQHSDESWRRKVESLEAQLEMAREEAFQQGWNSCLASQSPDGTLRQRGTP